jgi:hypothetical protein
MSRLFVSETEGPSMEGDLQLQRVRYPLKKEEKKLRGQKKG